MSHETPNPYMAAAARGTLTSAVSMARKTGLDDDQVRAMLEEILTGDAVDRFEAAAKDIGGEAEAEKGR